MNTDKTLSPSEIDEPDPLPYVISLFILFLVALGVATWTCGIVYKEHHCVYTPDIWCADDWNCNTKCATGTVGVNNCFVTEGTSPTGLSSCVFGPDSATATICYNSTGATSGPCPCVLTGANNCLSNCGSGGLGNQPNGNCCCQPGATGCQFLTDADLPANCKASSS